MVLLWNRIYTVSCWVGFFLDPMFFFSPTVQKNNKCIANSWSTAIAFVIVRSMTDFINLMHMIRVFEPRAPVEEEPKSIFAGFYNFFIALPVPQIVLLLVLPRFMGSPGDNLFILCMAIYGQDFFRLIRFLRFLADQSGTVYFTDWAFSTIRNNLVLFVLYNHLVGSWWYSFGLLRLSRCLKDACRDSGFSLCSQLQRCEYWNKSGSRLNAWKNNTESDSCFTQDGFPYGIYDAVVNLSTEDSMLTRFLYSLVWGFQQVSTMAGNLKSGYSIGEIYFTMIIIAIGISSFTLLIGNLQNLLQGREKRSREMSTRRRVVAQWMNDRGLPPDIQREVREAERFRWLATRGVNVETLLEDLPDDLQRRIRRHLFTDFFEKMKLHNSPIIKDDTVLDSFCERFKQKTYIEGSKILDINGIVEKMVFIVRGSMQSVEEDGSIMYLHEGDACGEELLTWCLENSAVNQDSEGAMTSRRSSRSVQCVTNVEAFTLSDDDIEETIRRFISSFQDQQLQGINHLTGEPLLQSAFS